MDLPVILSARRTPIGKFRGALSGVGATELGAAAIAAAVEAAGVEPGAIEGAILGNVVAAGVGQAPARQAALGAGLPDSVAALTVNKVCGSGLEAVTLASRAIRLGDAELLVAGGMESMSRAPYLLARDGPPLGDRTLADAMLLDGLRCARSGRAMGEIADDLARRDAISRADQDAFALESHRRACRAVESGAFAAEIVPVRVPGGKGGPIVVSGDEGPRPDASPDRLAALRPAFGPGGTVTAGNASMISDGAAALVVASPQRARRLGRAPMARIVASASAAMAPEDLFIAPVGAIRRALDRAGLEPDQLDLIELNEAFAAQMLACGRRLGLPPDRLNVRGGAIALGHPIGASGARVLVTLLHALEAAGGRYGLAALCLGGGEAVAMVVERVVGD